MQNNEIPLVNWPKEKGEYRIVQFWDKKEKKPYLRFNDDENHIYLHACIVEKFAKDVGAEVEESMGRDGLLVFLKENSPFSIWGMGVSRITPETKGAVFGKRSRDYNMLVSRSHIEALKNFFPDWKLEMEDVALDPDF